MSVQIRRLSFDFLATDHKSSTPVISLFPDGLPTNATPKHLGTKCIMRWYLGLHGEGCPHIAPMQLDGHGSDRQYIYRYDWVFGITLIEGFYWDWQKELPDEGPLAIHVVLQSVGNAAEAIPVAATIRALHPSRNTKGFWEQAWTKLPGAAASVAKIGEWLHPAMGSVADGLSLASNTLESQEKSQKNWFLYQFFDEKLRAPTVEWRINKNVLREYGPLLRGSLFLAFNGSNTNTGFIRVKLRPQISYCMKDDISYMIPTDKMPDDEQVSIDVKPREGARLETVTL